jgi:hypothetical protein
VNQFYDIPPEFGLNQYDYHDRAIYSMWRHFVDLCLKTNKPENMWLMHENDTFNSYAEQTYMDSPFASEISLSSHQATSAEDDQKSSVNKFMPKVKRLPIFIELATIKEETKPQKIVPEAFNLYDGKYLGNPSPRTIRFEDTFSFIPEQYIPRDLDSIFFSDQFP